MVWGAIGTLNLLKRTYGLTKLFVEVALKPQISSINPDLAVCSVQLCFMLSDYLLVLLDYKRIISIIRTVGKLNDPCGRCVVIFVLSIFFSILRLYFPELWIRHQNVLVVLHT